MLTKKTYSQPSTNERQMEKKLFARSIIDVFIMMPKYHLTCPKKNGKGDGKFLIEILFTSDLSASLRRASRHSTRLRCCTFSSSIFVTHYAMRSTYVYVLRRSTPSPSELYICATYFLFDGKFHPLLDYLVSSIFGENLINTRRRYVMIYLK